VETREKAVCAAFSAGVGRRKKYLTSKGADQSGFGINDLMWRHKGMGR
jgi:hypothetical protein